MSIGADTEAVTRSLHAAVMSLHDEMVSQYAPAPLLSAYETWINTTWGPFYREYADGSWFDRAFDAAIRLQRDYEDYRARYIATGGVVSHPAPAPPPPPDNDDGPGFFSGLGVGTLIAIGVVAYFLWWKS